MKTMTCKQLGGTCELPLSGATADEVKHPIKGMSWYRDVKREFATPPDA